MSVTPFRLASAFRYAADLVLPSICVSCAAAVTRHNLLCPACWRAVNFISPPVCDRLGVPFSGYSGEGPPISMQALANPPIFARARAAAFYSGIMKRLIIRFKFQDRHEALPLFVTLLSEAGGDLLRDAEVLVPVPLHRLRLLQRRFNQSALLARGLSRTTGIPSAVSALKRIRRTAAQVGLSHDARLSNVANAFVATGRAGTEIAGRSVLLIDDVLTTGATANACASALLKAGARRVDVLALALVIPGTDDGEASEIPGIEFP